MSARNLLEQIHDLIHDLENETLMDEHILEYLDELDSNLNTIENETAEAQMTVKYIRDRVKGD